MALVPVGDEPIRARDAMEQVVAPHDGREKYLAQLASCHEEPCREEVRVAPHVVCKEPPLAGALLEPRIELGTLARGQGM